MKDNYLKFFNQLKEKVINTDETLSIEEVNKLKKIIEEMKFGINEGEFDLMTLGRILDYNTLKMNGKTKEELKKYFEEDNMSLKNSLKIFNENIGFDHSHMFGYPANMVNDSYLNAYFRWLESQMFFTNSCGDAYHPGNYRMNNAEAELKIIEEFKKNLNLPSEYWGYINAGGTEGNFWGLREGITKFNNGVIYYSDAAHYSVSKFLEIINNFPVEKIKSTMGKVDEKVLINKIKENYYTKNQPAIILLTCGTTALGSVDDVTYIKNALNELSIPHYIHLDAAMYGGIPKNQIKSPTSKLLNKLGELNLDSISISLHKYLGNPRVNGILLAKSQTNQDYIDYIGQRDITFLGSRDFLPFSTLQRIKEVYGRSNENEYYNNIKIFEKLLFENNISYIKGEENGNTFIIDKPDDEICKKYQLSTFTYDGRECAHIIIFPYHKLENMEELVNDIKIKNKIKRIGEIK